MLGMITLFLTVPKRSLFLIVFIAFACGFVGPSHAASDKWALLIGVDKCEAVGELKVCSADALALKSVLQQIGYPDNHITVLVDNNQSNINATPTIGNVERAIKRLAQVAKADDKIFFFFSGHGVTHDGTSFLVPTDGDLTRGVSLTWIKDQFAACKAKEKVMILDACHSGAAKGVSGITPDLKTVGNLVMLLSCEKDQVSWPDKQGRHSVFTSAILDGLSGKAANADRKVTHQTLADYVYDSVRDWTYENQKNEQTPVLVADTSGDIVLADIALMKPSVTSDVDGATPPATASAKKNKKKSKSSPATASISLPADGNWQSESSGDFGYSIDGNNLTITNYTGSGGAVVIPSTINGKIVTSIGDASFYRCATLTSVTIPDSVTSVGNNAFSECDGLTSITIPRSVVSIGMAPIYGCPNLTAIAVDELNAFYSSKDGILFDKSQTSLIQCPAGTTLRDYTIPSSVTTLGMKAFNSCTSLTNIVIPTGVTSLGDSVFASSPNLASIIIPDSVVRIGRYAFAHCIRLSKIYFQGNAPIGASSLCMTKNRATVYYLPNTTGWTNPWGGCPTKVLNP